MSNPTLQEQLDAFDHWKKRQIRTIEQLQPWLKQQNLYTKESKHSIESALLSLNSENITVAIVGEFSRGKTELINALFFNDYGKRLLPTEAGRTTMCPTEIFQDNGYAPCLQLLPIESRLSDTSLIELQQDKSHWVEYPLDLKDAQDIEHKLRHITENKTVSLDEAKALGLGFDPEMDALTDDNQVEIPRWRMAAINIRHPLLAQGLRVMDTPGLNAIGNEPELTYEILPNAQAKLFVLGADTGVTRSDLEIWQQFSGKNNKGVIVVLNKTDTLWDELRSEEDVDESIRKQCEIVARILDIDETQVYATSAQKALVAHIKDDEQLKHKSKIFQIESYLATTMINNRQQLIIEQSGEQMDHALAGIESVIASRLQQSIKQIQDLANLSNKSEAAIEGLMKKAKRDKLRYQSSILSYRESRETFKRYGTSLLEALDTKTLNEIIENSHQTMSGAWTTRGLKEAMKLMYADINQRMEVSSEKTQAMRRLVRAIYRRFQTDHKFQLAQPIMFSIVSYQVELGLLHQQSEIFRKSPRTMLTEQHFAVKRYFHTIVRKTQKLFANANNEAEHWLNTALEPLTIQVKEHRGALSDQLNNLKEAGKSRNTVRTRIKTLNQQARVLKGQMGSLKNVRQALKNTTLPEADGRVKPHLVKNTA